MNSGLKRPLLWAAQALVLLALLWLIDKAGGPGALAAPWRRVPPALIGLVCLAQLASYSLRALRIYWAESAVPRGAWAACLRLILLNNTLNLLLPARTGEASFPLLMQRWFGVPLAQGTGTLLWLRLLDLNVLAVLGLLFFMPTLNLAPAMTWRVLAILAALLPLATPALNRHGMRRVVGRSGKASRLFAQLLAGVPQGLRQVLIDLLLSWSAWAIKLAALAAVFAVLAALPTHVALLGAIGGDLSTVLPLHMPGGFGTYEAGVLALVATTAQPSSVLLTAAVSLHLLVLGIALLAGGAAWLAGAAVRKSQP